MSDLTEETFQEQEREQVAQGAVVAASRQPPGPAAKPPLSLTFLEHNCNRPARGCLSRLSEDGGIVVMAPPCKASHCRNCGPKKRAELVRGIVRAAQREGLTKLLTFTLDPKKLPEGMMGLETIPHIRYLFRKLDVALRRRYPGLRRIVVIELQENGRAHLHVLCNTYIPHAWLQERWEAVGGGRQVNAKYVDVHRVARYVASYLGKGARALPAGVRRFSASVGMRVLEKQGGGSSGWKYSVLSVAEYARGFGDGFRRRGWLMGLLPSWEFRDGGRGAVRAPP